MEAAKPGSSKVAFKWTLIYVVTSIVITYAMQLLNANQTSSAKYFTYIPFIAFMFLAQKEYRDQLGGFITFGEGFLAGFLYAVFSAIILAVFTYVYFTILSPQVWQQLLDAQKEAFKDQNLSGERVDQAMQLTQKYGIIFATIGILIVSPIIGAIIALIGAAIFKKERSIMDIERDSSGYTDPVS